MMTMRLADLLEVDSDTATHTFYASLLMYAGCTTDADLSSRIFAGGLTINMAPVEFGSPARRRRRPSRLSPRPIWPSAQTLRDDSPDAGGRPVSKAALCGQMRDASAAISGGRHPQPAEPCWTSLVLSTTFRGSPVWVVERLTPSCTPRRTTMECSHDTCTCIVEGPGAYCSPDCTTADPVGMSCACGHPQCTASAPNVEEPLV
jgi:hypothetical protein